jgi:general secretion pathway protein B
VSYILDALKKSEAERSRGVVPTLLTPPQTSFRSGVVGWVLIAVLIVNAGLFAAWLYWPRTAGSTAAIAREPVAVATPEAASNAPAPQSKPLPEPQPPLEASVREQPTTVAPRPTSRQPDVVAESDSGAADVSFSTHVYATDPSMRAVTMNGRRFVEGDTIRPGVRIREITETGVILDVNGRPISVDVLQDWR